MTSTAMPCTTALGQLPPLAMSQMTKTARDTAMTAGTKMPEIRSAMRWMGALLEVASSTRRMMWARAVSSPTLVARILK